MKFKIGDKVKVSGYILGIDLNDILEVCELGSCFYGVHKIGFPDKVIFVNKCFLTKKPCGQLLFDFMYDSE